MTNSDNQLRDAQRLAFAFRLGAMGSIVFGAIALTSARLAGLVALAVWTNLTLFVFPAIYDWAVTGEPPVEIPEWFIRGPHQ